MPLAIGHLLLDQAYEEAHIKPSDIGRLLETLHNARPANSNYVDPSERIDNTIVLYSLLKRHTYDLDRVVDANLEEMEQKHAQTESPTRRSRIQVCPSRRYRLEAISSLPTSGAHCHCRR